jgi:hypothetical protein
MSVLASLYKNYSENGKKLRKPTSYLIPSTLLIPSWFQVKYVVSMGITVIVLVLVIIIVRGTSCRFRGASAAEALWACLELRYKLLKIHSENEPKHQTSERVVKLWPEFYQILPSDRK